MSDTHTAKKIIERAIQGDVVAKNELYVMFAQPIYRYIVLRVDNRMDAEDLLQEVFIKIYSRLQSIRYDDERGIMPLFYTIARNTIIDFYRKKKPEEVTDMMEDFPDTQDNPYEDAVRMAEKNRIQALLLTLPIDAREIVILRYIQELSNKEISQIAGKSEDAIRQIQSRAIKSLKKLL